MGLVLKIIDDSTVLIKEIGGKKTFNLKLDKLEVIELKEELLKEEPVIIMY